MSARERINAFLNERGISIDADDTTGTGLTSESDARRRLDQLAEFRRRKSETASALAPGPAPGPNWIPLGPSGSTNGQTTPRSVVSGRCPGLAVSDDGQRVYAGTANGGVWRSIDSGRSWKSMSDLFDLDPLPPGSGNVDSLACGTLALVDGATADQDRVYVGTGEPFTNLDAYLGVGMLRTDNGGDTWSQESSSPSLIGFGVYKIAVDPVDPDHAVAATSNGIYRRSVSGGTPSWDREGLPGVANGSRVTSVVAHHDSGTTTFYAAIERQGVITSTRTGGTTSNWSPLVGDTGFPSADVRRITLAISTDADPTLYALVAKASNHHLLGVFRIDIGATRWTEVDNTPADLFGRLTDSGGNPRNGQGWYDHAIVVDSTNRNVFYIGGAGSGSGSYIHRCTVHQTGSGASLTYTAATVNIGLSAHPDVHALVVSPADHRTVWCGCDGGVYVAPNALESTGAAFQARNSGLSTMTLNGLAHHPTLPGYVFSGAQDNGGLRYGGEEVWDHQQPGDGGATVINWNTPTQIISGYINRSIRQFNSDSPRYTSTSGGNVHGNANDPGLFYPPIVGCPPGAPVNPVHARRVAWGGNVVYLSDSFGTMGTWNPIPTAGNQFPAGVNASAMAFTNFTRLFVGTNDGHLWEYVFNPAPPAGWTRTDHGRPPGESNTITSICADPAVAGGTAVYLTVGGRATAPVWRFDSSQPAANQWSNRSGTGGNRLLRVHHSKVLADPNNPATLWVGADIGVWQSNDGGSTTWTPFSNNLPDAAVIDLDLHPTARMLRASTHGRGVFEIPVDGRAQPAVELTIRTNRMDTARGAAPVSPAVGPAVLDPFNQAVSLTVDQSPDICTDAPNADGRLIADPQIIDPVIMTRDLTGLNRTVLANPAAAPNDATTKVYVRVRNRGPVVADGVQVMLLLGRVNGSRPDLPAGYEADVAAANPIATPNWHTVGFRTVDGVGNGKPGIAVFDLPSSLLPPTPGSVGDTYPLLALIHHPQDPYNVATIDVDALATNDRRAAVVTATVAAAAGAAAGGALTPPAEPASAAPLIGDLPPKPSRLTSAATALLAHQRLGDVVDGLTAKVNARRVEPASGGFAHTANATEVEHQVLALAKRALATYEQGPVGPDRPHRSARATSTFALLGATGHDVVATVAPFAPGGRWIADTLRRGTPDPQRSAVNVAAAELAMAVGAAAKREPTTADEQARIDSFTMGMLAATAAQTLTNPLLADLLAKDTNLDWGPDSASAGAAAVDSLIRKRIFGAQHNQDLGPWWPAVDAVPSALWTGLRKALETELGLPDNRNLGFGEFEADFDAGKWLTDTRLRNGYALWRGDLSSGQMHWTGWWGWVSMFTLASPLAILLNRALPNGQAAFVPGQDFNERSAFELMMAGMGIGGIGPFVTSMALWSAIDEHTEPFVNALILFILRAGLTGAGLGTSAIEDQEAIDRWLYMFTPMAGMDVYAAIRAIAAPSDPPGDGYVFAMQTSSAVNGLLSVAVGALMNVIADESEEEGYAWLAWGVYTLLMFLALGMPLGVVLAGGGGWREWFLRQGPRPGLSDSLANAGLDFPEPRAMARTFDDSTLWHDQQNGAAAELENLGFPSGMRGLVRIWHDPGTLEISHDADLVQLRVGAAPATSITIPYTGLTGTELVTAITGTGIAGIHAEAVSAADPDYLLPAPETVNDPGDTGRSSDHDSALGLFVQVGADRDHAYVLRHAPRAELSTRQGLGGASGSDLDEMPVVPDGGDLEFSGLGASADLAVLLSLGAVPTLSGGSLAIPADEWDVSLSPTAQTVAEVSQVFRRWNLAERRSNEWNLVVTGGARSEKAGSPEQADALMRQYAGARTSPAADGAQWVEAMGWLPLWRAWLRVAADPGTDSDADIVMPFTPVVTLADGSRRALTNAELTEGVRFLLDLEG